MAILGNAPAEQTVLRLMARKSFALGLWIQDQNGNPLDIAACTIRMVVRKQNFPASVSDDSSNLIVNSTATLIAPSDGFARFALQASDLNHAPGEYDFAVTLVDGGYSSVIIQGIIELEQNTEFTSIADQYSDAGIATSLRVLLREQTALAVHTGPSLAPGQATFTLQMEQKLLEIYADAVAAGQTLNADDIPDGINKVMMTAAERAQLAEGLTVAWNDIIGKPTLGTISSHDTSEFLQPAGVSGADIVSGQINKDRLPKMSAHNGFSYGTAAPSGGTSGDIYFQIP